jgi:hypothetical protein
VLQKSVLVCITEGVRKGRFLVFFVWRLRTRRWAERVNSWCVERVNSFTIAAWFRRRATFACCGVFNDAMWVDFLKINWI